MADLVKLSLTGEDLIKGIPCIGPTKVADAVETDLSTPDTTIEFDTRGIRFIAWGMLFANYTGVTVKWQRSFDGGTTWADVSGATTSTSGAMLDFEPKSPLCRLSIAGTRSAGADTMEVWVYMER